MSVYVKDVDGSAGGSRALLEMWSQVFTINSAPKSEKFESKPSAPSHQRLEYEAQKQPGN